MYEVLELHLAGVPLSRKHAEAIKKVVGKTRRSSGFARFVTLPASERELIDNLVRSYPCPQGNGSKKGTCIVARGGTTYGEPAWVSVQYVASEGQLGASKQFEVLYASARALAVKRGILPSDEQVAWDHMHAVASAENAQRNRRIHLEVMVDALQLYLARDLGPDAEHRAMAAKFLKQYQEGRVL
jgi:hypothetical protein